MSLAGLHHLNGNIIHLQAKASLALETPSLQKVNMSEIKPSTSKG